jgi:hypothetical protein
MPRVSSTEMKGVEQDDCVSMFSGHRWEINFG